MRFAARFSLAAWFCAAWPVIAAADPLVVELWPGKVPDETGDIGPEKFSCRRSWTASRSRSPSRPGW